MRRLRRLLSPPAGTPDWGVLSPPAGTPGSGVKVGATPSTGAGNHRLPPLGETRQVSSHARSTTRHLLDPPGPLRRAVESRGTRLSFQHTQGRAQTISGFLYRGHVRWGPQQGVRQICWSEGQATLI